MSFTYTFDQQGCEPGAVGIADDAVLLFARQFDGEGAVVRSAWVPADALSQWIIHGQETEITTT